MRIWQNFIKRTLPNVGNSVVYSESKSMKRDEYKVRWRDNSLQIEAQSFVAAAHALYIYLKKYCKVNLSWNGNRDINIVKLEEFEGAICGRIDQKYRVYMNYCTLNYSMSWWNFDRWQKELDFMALNGINMPLMVIGTEAVWYETLKQFNYTSQEALNTVSGPAFWAWQLMTNIVGYLPPPEEKYVYDRLELGKKVLESALEMGMYPIQQGFSGFVPLNMKDKYPNAKILPKSRWCMFPATGQIDPLDPLFMQMGRAYLDKQKELLGAYHFYAADPFHEGAPPKNNIFYLKKVGKVIDKLFNDYDSDAVWVMQSWSIRAAIAKAVPIGKLLILDLNSMKCKPCKYFWGHDFVVGYLHNFGGKNAMQGRASAYAKNIYTDIQQKGKKVVGTGMFMEGIEQNPYIYDMQFDMITRDGDMDVDTFTRDYIVRRYGKFNENVYKAYKVLLQTCYCDSGQHDNEIGTMLAARPFYKPYKSSPCDNLEQFYSHEIFLDALKYMYAAREDVGVSDGYQYDLMDISRQALSNLFYKNQLLYAKYAADLNIAVVERLGKEQLQLLQDIDKLLSHRSETCLSRWICDAQNLASDDILKKYYDLNAKVQITLWGDIDSDCALHDYAWKEWSGLISQYYYMRWEYFYDKSLAAIKQGAMLSAPSKVESFGRPSIRTNDFYSKLTDKELAWCNTYQEYEYPIDADVIPVVGGMIKKYFNAK